MASYHGERPHGGIHWLGWVVVALVLVVVIGFFGSMSASGFYPQGMFAGPPYYGWYFFPLGLVFFVIFVVIIFRLVFWGFGGWGWRRGYWYSNAYRHGDAREILRQRYARGEITKDQFDQMMKDLEQH
ncbi:MAG: SHOCT domain-containing protein [Nitrososphaerota archaeon]|nr:SHOCT domain-containing protein [Nitrososphaerota archaeon]MDG7025463.1 SHOCT domain-containing protein [Nitrososphaerota archaeon]